MTTSFDRFSNQNKDQLVLIPRLDGLKNLLITRFVGIIIDSFPIILLIIWDILYYKLNFNSYLFIIIHISLILVSIFFIYNIIIKFNDIKVSRFTIEVEKLTTPFEFIFLSDLHIGKTYSSTSKIRLKKIIDLINILNPELVIFGGDFLNYEFEHNLLFHLKEIKCKNKIGVYGNHDSLHLKGNKFAIPKDLISFLNKLDIKILNNEGYLYKNHIDEIYIGGIPDLYSKEFNLDNTFKKSKKDSLKILVSHNPDIIDFIKEDDDIDLILSGHNHSGQIYLKPLGIILPMPTKRKWLTRGVFNILGKTKLLLSQGIGNSGVRSRIGTINELCIVKLIPKI